eukprot:SM000034S12678  [mRNA]  locus=s34:89503:90243:- [translate_table: standard]
MQTSKRYKDSRLALGNQRTGEKTAGTGGAATSPATATVTAAAVVQASAVPPMQPSPVPGGLADSSSSAGGLPRPARPGDTSGRGRSSAPGSSPSRSLIASIVPLPSPFASNESVGGGGAAMLRASSLAAAVADSASSTKYARILSSSAAARPPLVRLCKKPPPVPPSSPCRIDARWSLAHGYDGGACR